MVNIKEKETVQRGTAFFPIQYYLCDTGSPLYNLPVHWHMEYEIIHVLNGEYSIFLDNREFMLKSDEICFIRDGVLHGDGHIKTGSIYESVVLDVNLIRNRNYAQDSFIRDIVEHKIYVDPILEPSSVKMHAAAMLLYDVIKNEPDGYEMLTVSALYQFFGYIKQERLYTEEKIVEKAKDRSEQLKAVLNLIQEQYGTSISLDEMAHTAGMSPKYFCRVFHEMTSRTPMEYLNSFRIDRSCAQLRNGDESLLDIAYNCGFNDFSYFIKTFKRFKGMTPRKYRNFNI